MFGADSTSHLLRFSLLFIGRCVGVQHLQYILIHVNLTIDHLSGLVGLAHQMVKSGHITPLEYMSS
jgi:hypothetical protein